MTRCRASVCALVLTTPVLLATAAAGPQDAVERGRYLANAMDCGACHTPWKLGPQGPEPDAARLLSGHPQDAALPPPPALPPGPWNVVTAGNTAWAGPWGISYSTNLTSDEETGIGGWTEEMFVKSMRTGRHRGMGRQVLPPMPKYPEVTEGDLKAMFAYFQSVPAIKNRVPRPAPPPARD